MHQHTKEIRRALLTSLPYILVVFFLDDLDKLFANIHSHLGNPLLVLYMFIATVFIFALLIHTILDFKEDYKAIGYKAVIPPAIYLIALLNSFWSPLRVSSDIFKSRIVHHAYRREQYGHAHMEMLKDSTLAIRYPGPFGMSGWEYGRWLERGDTFYLTYETSMDTIIAPPDTLLLSSGLLIPVGIPTDTIKLYKNHFFKMGEKRK